MKRRIAYAGAVALAALAAAPALAVDVSFVSVTGDDARNCAAPATACRSFQRAHDATSPHGEIVALTPGDYRPVTIAKSISVTGVEGAGIFGGPADSIQITISAGAGGVVHLTGLTLDGASTANSAIRVNQAAAVTIRHCSIRDTAGNGVSANVNEALRLLIEDTSLSNGNDNLNLEGRALVHRVVSTGARASAIVSPFNSLTMSETSAAASRDGVFVVAPVFMTRSAVTGNSGFGVSGDFTSAGDNLIRGNGTNVSGTVTNIGRQ